MEVLAASAILALSLLVILALYETSLRLSYVSGRTSEAASLAQAKIEELRGQGFAALKQAPDNQEECVGSYTRKTTLTRDYNGNPRLIRVDVRVTWEDDEGSHKVSLATLVADTETGVRQ